MWSQRIYTTSMWCLWSAEEWINLMPDFKKNVFNDSDINTQIVKKKCVGKP